MFINEYTKEFRYSRKSKLGTEHPYFRQKTIVVLRCDNCNNQFERARGSMNPNRINNNFFHVCSGCDAKVFAQRKWTNIVEVCKRKGFHRFWHLVQIWRLKQCPENSN